MLLIGGAVAQLGERLVRNEEVRGSNPLGSTIQGSVSEKANYRRRFFTRPLQLWPVGRRGRCCE